MELTLPLTDLDGLVMPIPDIRKLDNLNSQTIVSCKCTCNLFDLTNLWKKIVLMKRDQQVLPDNYVPANHDEDVDMAISNDN